MSNSEPMVQPSHERMRGVSCRRNHPCPCGSGRKFKACYLAWAREEEDERRRAREEEDERRREAAKERGPIMRTALHGACLDAALASLAAARRRRRRR